MHKVLSSAVAAMMALSATPAFAQYTFPFNDIVNDMNDETTTDTNSDVDARFETNSDADIFINNQDIFDSTANETNVDGDLDLSGDLIIGASDPDRLIRFFLRPGMSVSNVDNTDLERSEFDVMRFMSDACFDPVSDEEARRCALLFGINGDLRNILESGLLFDYLEGSPEIVDPEGVIALFFQAMLTEQNETTFDGMDFDGDTIDDGTLDGMIDNSLRDAVTRRVLHRRAQQIWQHCENTVNMADRPACFQSARRILKRTNTPLNSSDLSALLYQG